MDKYSGKNFSTKIVLMAEAILLISGILFCTVSIYRARTDIRKAIWQRMLDISNSAAGSVDGDVLGSLTEEDVGSDTYNDLYEKLAVFRDNVELEYIYSLKEIGDGQFIFTMDLDEVTPASYGDPCEYTDALGSAARGEAAVDKIPYTDQWGTFYSAYSPVFNSAGEVACIVAVDFSAAWFDEQLSAQTRAIVLSYIVIFTISLLLAAFLLMTTVRPFVRMQGQLLEEKIAAESANRAKSDFLANMSHEIRTPINTMLGMNEMILRESRAARDDENNDADREREALGNIVGYAGDIETAGHNLLAIINDVLDFSKIEAGRLDLVEAPYRISALAAELRTMTVLRARDKGLEFTVDVSGDIPDEVCGDVGRVRQILTNLLSNAVKYTDKGSVRMTIDGTVQDDGILLLRASVKDTGKGIRQEDVDKLFDKFSRLEMEENSTVEGTGLGLTITHRLLEMMDGKITVESTYREGSVFTVTIPQKIVSDTKVGEHTEHTGDGAAADKKGRTGRETFIAPDARILVVDDTKTNLTIVTYLLRNTGVSIDTATGGADAVSMAARTAYDIIFMDQRMPEMDGTEALHKIRSTEGGASREVPIICFTADAVVGARERYLEEGFSDYITKPVSSNMLEKMMIRYLPGEKVKIRKMA